MQAESFFTSANLLAEHAMHKGPFNPPYMFPSVTCQAFSLELYLKCLLRMQGSNYRGTHDLEQLYDLLSQENRDAIERIASKPLDPMIKGMFYIGRDPHLPQSLLVKDLIHESRRAFETFRYIHERIGTGDGEGWTAGPVVGWVRERLMELKPEWREFKFNQPDSEPPDDHSNIETTPTS
jgi:hypothetical protein